MTWIIKTLDIINNTEHYLDSSVSVLTPHLAGLRFEDILKSYFTYELSTIYADYVKDHTVLSNIDQLAVNFTNSQPNQIHSYSGTEIITHSTQRNTGIYLVGVNHQPIEITSGVHRLPRNLQLPCGMDPRMGADRVNGILQAAHHKYSSVSYESVEGLLTYRDITLIAARCQPPIAKEIIMQINRFFSY